MVSISKYHRKLNKRKRVYMEENLTVIEFRKELNWVIEAYKVYVGDNARAFYFSKNSYREKS